MTWITTLVMLGHSPSGADKQWPSLRPLKLTRNYMLVLLIIIYCIIFIVMSGAMILPLLYVVMHCTAFDSMTAITVNKFCLFCCCAYWCSYIIYFTSHFVAIFLLNSLVIYFVAI